MFKFKYIPNILITFRIILAFIIFQAILERSIIGAQFALAFYLLASLTDTLDGLIARKFNFVTSFGKIMDPIADKILWNGLLLIFGYLGYISIWLVLLVILREILITIIRLLALKKHRIISAESGGKTKTIWQFVCCLILIIYHWSILSSQVTILSNSLNFLASLSFLFVIYYTISSGLDFLRSYFQKSNGES